MAIRFRKSLKIMPGVRVNLSGSGASLSLGGRGATVNIGKRGVTSTLNIPGSGLSWSARSGWSQSARTTPVQEISGLTNYAAKIDKEVRKAAEKADAVVQRVDKAIDILNNGRGVTRPKFETFLGKIDKEEDRLNDIEGEVEEAISLYEAMETRLLAMKFGWFAGPAPKLRDGAVQAIKDVRSGAQQFIRDLERLGDLMASKVAEIEGRLE